MSLHIARFVDRLQSLEGRGQQNFTMTMSEAKDLHADITRLLLTLQNLLEEKSTADKDQIIEVQVQGGSF